MRDIKADVSRMQARGNFGDGELLTPCSDLHKTNMLISTGFWSDGNRLQDRVRMGGEGLRE